MATYTALPYFLLSVAAVALIALPAFRFTDSSVSTVTRYGTLDGLRGFLAFTVFVFHVVTTDSYIRTGAWMVPQQSFYALLGPIGVSLFFMTTGFLFWSKLLSAKGRMNWPSLYRNRLFRIAPMYLVAVVAMLIVVAVKTGFTLREPAADVLLQVLQWLALGFFNLQPNVNGYSASQILAAVTWTISYEWAFYGSLILLAYFARRATHLYYVANAFVLCMAGKIVFDSSVAGFAALFLAGMTVASLLHDGIRLKLPDRALSLTAIASLIPVFGLHAIGVPLSGYGTIVALFLAVFFYLICSGASLFGLLFSRPAQRLGNISYSVYLLQGLALTLTFSVPFLRSFALESAMNYWFVALICSSLLLAVSSLTYFFVEMPCIRFGKKREQPLSQTREVSVSVPLKNTLDPRPVAGEGSARVTIEP